MIAKPEAAVPRIRIVFCVALNSAIAFVTRPAGATAGASDWRAGWSNAIVEPRIAATA